MLVFKLVDEQQFDPKRHVEKIVGRIAKGDVTVACWEPSQISPYHCHPNATEIYFCFQGGGVMRTPGETVEVTPGSFVVHPPGELHEYENGLQRTLLFRVRYGDDMSARFIDWRGNSEWKPSAEDTEYFHDHPLTDPVAVRSDHAECDPSTWRHEVAEATKVNETVHRPHEWTIMMLKWLKRIFRNKFVADIPDEWARCEFECKVSECLHGEWERCERRIDYARRLKNSDQRSDSSQTAG